MERIIEKVLDPSTIWVLVPLAAVVFWGLTSAIRALRGSHSEVEDLHSQVEELRRRIDHLERATVAQPR